MPRLLWRGTTNHENRQVRLGTYFPIKPVMSRQGIVYLRTADHDMSPGLIGFLQGGHLLKNEIMKEGPERFYFFIGPCGVDPVA